MRIHLQKYVPLITSKTRRHPVVGGSAAIKMSPGSSNRFSRDHDAFTPSANLREEEVRAVEHKILNMRQTGSAFNYAKLFREHALFLGWSHASLMAIFYNGLKEDVKNEIYMKDRPETLEEYIAMAVTIDNRLYARRLEKRDAKRRNL